MCNCFLVNAENFIFDPKCKPSDTPDCDWHDSIVSSYSTVWHDALSLIIVKNINLGASIPLGDGRLTARSRGVSKPLDWNCNECIVLKCDRHFDSATTEEHVKFKSDWKSLNPNLETLRLYDILR